MNVIYICLKQTNIQKIIYKINNYKFIGKIFKKCIDK